MGCFSRFPISITLNHAAVTFAKGLIKDGKIKNDEGHWGQRNPDSAAENAYLKKHEIEKAADELPHALEKQAA